MKKFWLALGLLLLTASAASSQGVQQQGGVVPQHMSMWVANNAIKDAGTAARMPQGLQPYELGITAQPNKTGNPFPAVATGLGPNGENFCLYDSPVTVAGHYLCFSANLGGNTPSISSGTIGGATPGQGLQFIINGTTFLFPGGGNGNVIAPTTPAPPTGDIAVWNGGTTLIGGHASTGTIGGLTVVNSNKAIENINGDSLGWNQNYAGYSWETSIGTASVPFNGPGPSVKISRTEAYTDGGVTCQHIQNNVDCNSGLEVVVSSAPSNTQQSQAIVGVANLYTSGIKDNNDVAGVFGLARGLGGGNKAFAFAGYAEAVSPLTWAVGAEITIWNATGTNAVDNTSNAYGHNGWMIDCGAGTLTAYSCNNAFFVIYVGNQFINGYVVGPATVIQRGFYDLSDAVDSFATRGNHIYQFDGEQFSVTGASGTSHEIGVFIGDFSGTADPSTLGNRLYVRTAGIDQALFEGIASSSSVRINSTAGGNVSQVQFEEDGSADWSVGRGTDDEFFIIYNPTSMEIMHTAAGVLKLGAAQNLAIATSGAVTVGQLAGTGSRPVCATAAGLLEAGSLSSGLTTCP